MTKLPLYSFGPAAYMLAPMVGVLAGTFVLVIGIALWLTRD